MLTSKNLQAHYDRELRWRKENPDDSRLLNPRLKLIDPKSFGLAFGCADLISFLHKEWIENKKVLDFGCGAGADLAYIGQLFKPSEALGLDLSPAMVTEARSLFEERQLLHIDAANKSLHSLPDESYDCILSNAVIHLNADKASIFQELFRILKPDGQLLIADFVTESPLHEDLRHEFLQSDGTFLFGGLDSRNEYYDGLASVGFEEIESMSRGRFEPDAEFTSKLSQNLQARLQESGFSIDVLRIQKSAEAIFSDRQCPTCRHTFTSRHIPSLNRQIHRRLFQLLKESRFPTVQCPKCRFELEPQPWQYHDMQEKFYAFVFPESFEIQKNALHKELVEPCHQRLPQGYTVTLCFGQRQLLQQLGQSNS